MAPIKLSVQVNAGSSFHELELPAEQDWTAAELKQRLLDDAPQYTRPLDMALTLNGRALQDSEKIRDLVGVSW